ncbi:MULTISPECIES: hypothetical protein [Cobetia]|uniref:Uncharacterized protein n=1 Tax=Cobetia amphilecti TaxID=1055104 RepID=A0AAP4TVX1_9GAMM|nr:MULTISPECIES: hypothetical protein [Cobetia]MDO6670512.1 hypothetical protein [Cobetia amphilecti]
MVRIHRSAGFLLATLIAILLATLIAILLATMMAILLTILLTEQMASGRFFVSDCPLSLRRLACLFCHQSANFSSESPHVVTAQYTHIFLHKFGKYCVLKFESPKG